MAACGDSPTMKRWAMCRTPVAAARPKATRPGFDVPIRIATEIGGGGSSTSRRNPVRWRARSSRLRQAGTTSTKRKRAALSSASRDAKSIALSSSAFSGRRDEDGIAFASRSPTSYNRCSSALSSTTGPTISSGTHSLGDDVRADDQHERDDLAGDRLVGPVDLEPRAEPARDGERQLRRGQPSEVLEGERGAAGHHHEHDGEQDAGQDQHLAVGQLVVQPERDDADRGGRREADGHALEHRGGARLQLQVLEEEDD